MDALDEARARLELHMQQKGLKHTRQREEILEAFFALGGHASIEELLTHVQSRMPGVGYATVYRSMRLFVEAGVADERHFDGGQTRFEPVMSAEHHDHLICSTCGTIFEFEDPTIEERQAAVAAAYGLRVTSHRHEIYGTCLQPETCVHRSSKAAAAAGS
jgi:Fur family ferric uptake transcriptional regulator